MVNNPLAVEDPLMNPVAHELMNNGRSVKVDLGAIIKACAYVIADRASYHFDGSPPMVALSADVVLAVAEFTQKLVEWAPHGTKTAKWQAFIAKGPSVGGAGVADAEGSTVNRIHISAARASVIKREPRGCPCDDGDGEGCPVHGIGSPDSSPNVLAPSRMAETPSPWRDLPPTHVEVNSGGIHWWIQLAGCVPWPVELFTRGDRIFEAKSGLPIKRQHLEGARWALCVPPAAVAEDPIHPSHPDLI